jgi:hypothetical protein
MVLPRNGGFQHHLASVRIYSHRDGRLFEIAAPHQNRHGYLNALRPAL